MLAKALVADYIKAQALLLYCSSLPDHIQLLLLADLSMMAYSTRERKTRSMQASSHTSMAVTAFDTGILVLTHRIILFCFGDVFSQIKCHEVA